MKTLQISILFLILTLLSINLSAQIPPPFPVKTKTLNLTVFLQGFYPGSGSLMNKCKDYVGSATVDKFSGTTVDTITVELHDATTYATIVYKAYNVPLNQNGTASIIINNPNSYISSYYITVKTRNHIETTTAAPVSFAASLVSYDFSNAISKAYGNNLKQIGNICCIFAGDINGDGAVNTSDRGLVITDLRSAKLGFYKTDLNGDGVVNTSDRGSVITNLRSAIIKKTP
ncbi:MAG: dockerin type I domain-containing protein [Bacteroidales bacterium]